MLTNTHVKSPHKYGAVNKIWKNEKGYKQKLKFYLKLIAYKFKMNFENIWRLMQSIFHYTTIIDLRIILISGWGL